MSSAYLLSLSSLLFLVLLPSHLVRATKFSLLNQTKDLDSPAYLELSSSASDQVFGLSHEGSLSINLTLSTNHTSPCPARLALCQASCTYVRGPNYRRRQSRPSAESVKTELITIACRSTDPSPTQPLHPNETSETGIAWCVTQNICKGFNSHLFTVQPNILQPNHMYLVGAALCNDQKQNQQTQLSFSGRAEFLNPDLIFPQLGYEEVLFPIFAAIITALLAVPFFLLTVAQLLSFGRQLPFRHVALYVLVAVLLKLLVAVITFVHFFTIAQTGYPQRWFMYVRLLLAFCADTFFIVALTCVASGFGVMPNSWFVEDRSPIFLVYIAVVLQLLIIIAVKVMFPFRFLGAITYTVAGGVIGAIVTVASYRNAQFLLRYGQLIEQSHIFLKSTPIPRLRRFYKISTVIMPIAYAINIIGVILFDYSFDRPDLFWGVLETVDATLLLWLSIFVFPRAKSALYVDMSNISNDRLHQAERWRARLQRQQLREERAALISSRANPSAVTEAANGVSPTATSDAERPSTPNAQRRTIRENLTQTIQRILRHLRGRESAVQPASQPIPDSAALDLETGETTDIREPQPPWIAWTSGMSLPRPSTYTWRGRQRPNNVVNQEGRPVPLIRVPIVLGSPEASSNVVMLTVGVPVAGVNALPKIYDEKGNEVSEIALPARARGRISTGAGGADDSNLGISSRLSLSERLGLSSLRLHRTDQRSGQAVNRKSSEMHGRGARGRVGSSAETGEEGEAGRGEATRSLSGSTTAECSDGTISTLDIR